MTARIALAGLVAVDIDGASVDMSGLGRLGRLFWAYLVCHRHRPVSKDELAEVLWGDDELPRSWDQMLRGNASKARSALAADGAAHRIEVVNVFGAYQVRLPAGTVVDIEEAGANVDSALRALREGRPDEAREAAAAALGVAAQGFLPGWSGVWVERRQAELREVRLRALELLSEAYGALGLWVEAAAAAAEAIENEPYRESAYVLLIAAHRGAGNPAEGLRVYERCRRVLAEELGASPSAATNSAYLSLLTDDATVDVAAPPGPPPLPATLTPGVSTFLVGRRDEVERLRRALEQATSAGRQAVMVGGEPGVGKTTLVTDFARYAYAQGATVLYGRCDEELGVAYQPFAEALRHYVAHCGQAELAAHVADHGGELGRIVPELARRTSDAPALPPAGSAGDRYRLFEAVTGLLAQAASVRPVVLVVDDLHWAPAPTLALLRHVLAARTPALVVVGTYRHTEVAPDDQLAALLADLRREPGVERMLLAGLDEAGVAALVEHREGHALDSAGEALARGLHARTGGNPFFVGEFIRLLADTSPTHRHTDGGREDDGVERLGLPDGIRDVVARRVARLSDAAQRVLTVASVVGFQFELGLLEAVTNAGNPDGALDAAEEALAAAVVTEIGTGRYQFAHAIVRDTIYSALSATRRARLHHHVGRALAAMPGDLDPRLPALAHHFAEAGADGGATEAGTYALAAGRQAFARCAWEDVVAFTSLGLAALSATDPEHLDARFELLLLAFETRGLMVADQPPRTLLEAAEVASRMGSPERLARAVSLYLFSDGQLDPRGVELAEHALLGLGEASPALRARVLASMSMARPVVAAGLAGARADEALALARTSGDAEALHAALFAQSMVLTDTPRARELLDVEEELYALGPMPGPVTGPRWRNGVGRGRAIARLVVGDRDGFEAGVDELEQRNLSIRNPGVAFQAALLRTALALLDGRFHDVERLVAEAGAIPARPEILLDPLAVQLCKLALELGTVAGHKADAARVASMRPNSIGLMSMLALVHAETGDRDAALAIVDRLRADGFARVVQSMTSTGFAYLAEVAASLDEPALAAAIYERYRPYAGLVVASGLVAHCPGSVDRYLGQLCTTVGRWDDAEAHFKVAVAVDAGLRAPPLLARSRYWFGRLLVVRDRAGDQARAHELLRAAGAAAAELGMTGLAAAASALLPQDAKG